MKKFAAITTALCATIGGLTVFCGTKSFAANTNQPETIYPYSFTAPEVSDYAVGNGVIAYAENANIYIYESENPTVFTAENKITALDFDDDCFFYESETGCFALNKTQGGVYESTETVHAFPVNEELYLDGALYRFNDGALHYSPKGSTVFVPVEGSEDDFRLLKQFEGVAYALGGSILYKIEGAQATPADKAFLYFGPTLTMPVSNTAERLKSFNSLELHFVTLGNDYITQINLDELNEEYFALIGNYATATRKANGESALLLCTVGNAAIVATGAQTYITLESNTQSKRDTATVDNECYEFVKIPCWAYSSPFVSQATQAYPLTANVKVKVLASLSSPELEYEFRKVAVLDEDGNETGEVVYVMSGFLSPYGFEDGNDPAEIPDPDYSEDDMVKTVVIVIVVIALFLTAVGYMVYVLIYKNKKPKS